jgi:hypothetical protein
VLWCTPHTVQAKRSHVSRSPSQATARVAAAAPLDMPRPSASSSSLFAVISSPSSSSLLSVSAPTSRQPSPSPTVPLQVGVTPDRRVSASYQRSQTPPCATAEEGLLLDDGEYGGDVRRASTASLADAEGALASEGQVSPRRQSLVAEPSSGAALSVPAADVSVADLTVAVEDASSNWMPICIALAMLTLSRDVILQQTTMEGVLHFASQRLPEQLNVDTVRHTGWEHGREREDHMGSLTPLAGTPRGHAFLGPLCAPAP